MALEWATARVLWAGAYSICDFGGPQTWWPIPATINCNYPITNPLIQVGSYATWCERRRAWAFTSMYTMKVCVFIAQHFTCMPAHASHYCATPNLSVRGPTSISQPCTESPEDTLALRSNRAFYRGCRRDLLAYRFTNLSWLNFLDFQQTSFFINYIYNEHNCRILWLSTWNIMMNIHIYIFMMNKFCKVNIVWWLFWEVSYQKEPWIYTIWRLERQEDEPEQKPGHKLRVGF